MTKWDTDVFWQWEIKYSLELLKYILELLKKMV
jgi:hypothetical protein